MYDLRKLFVVVAVLELFFGASALFIPPGATLKMLGWDLNPDGEWVAKILGVALLAQSATAWVLRHNPPPAIGWIFAFYQIGAAIVDVVIWVTLADKGVFSAPLARYSIAAAIPVHILTGVLLLVAAHREQRTR